MGIFSRFGDIVNSNINAILDKAEDPEKIVRLMIQEMEDTLVEVRTAAARCIADKKESSRVFAALENEAEDWQAKAELAVDKGREDLAKAALIERAGALRSADALRSQQRVIDEGLSKLAEDITRLEAKLADAKSRQKTLLARHQTASRRLEVRKKIHDYRIEDALIRFDQYERRMDDLEGHVEAFDIGERKDLRQEFSELESADAVDKELEALKAKRARTTKNQSSDSG
ncbi:MAG TPA: phage shock protein PspA [Gammaproteobacteria bacterium]|jgi:phage shock protein A